MILVSRRLLLRWGLIPFFAKGVPGKYSTINARIETLAASPGYRGPWKRGQRCIIPVNGFYEWHVKPDGSKQPYYITIADQPLFGFAGLWDRSEAADGTVKESATIITMPANLLMAEIHNGRARMPAILTHEDYGRWLAEQPDDAHATLRPYPSDCMVAWPVGTQVNSVRNNRAELIQPLTRRPTPPLQPPAETLPPFEFTANGTALVAPEHRAATRTDTVPADALSDALNQPLQLGCARLRPAAARGETLTDRRHPSDTLRRTL